MTDKKKDGKIDPFTRGFVRKSARKLAGKHGFRRQDRDEIEQRLYLKLAKHLHAADLNDPAWKAFVAKTVRRHIASMIRDNKAEKRDHRRVCSIHVVIGENEDGPVELAHTISERDGKAHRGCAPRSQQELAELALDMATCIPGLCDKRHREFCERLKHASISQVARDMDIPRTTLNAWLRKLRQRFEEQGLKDYLQADSSVR
jgi:RNA polymerase sigma factor (sigma-70 family)